MKEIIYMRQLDGWFDIHSHIMPAVDDGAKDWDMSKQMLEMAYEEGTRRMIATPHYHKRYRNVYGEPLKEQYEKLKELAKSIDNSFEVYLGNELYYNQDAGELLEQGVIQTLAGSDYVLVEFSPARDYRYIKHSLYQLQMDGYHPILAHMERYTHLLKHMDRIEELLEMGVYFQVNAGSVIGNSGFSIKQSIKKLLKLEYIHFIGTDAHNLEQRPPRIKKCAEYILKKYNSDYAQRLLFNNPMKIITNEYV